MSLLDTLDQYLAPLQQPQPDQPAPRNFTAQGGGNAYMQQWAQQEQQRPQAQPMQPQQGGQDLLATLDAYLAPIMPSQSQQPLNLPEPDTEGGRQGREYFKNDPYAQAYNRQWSDWQAQQPKEQAGPPKPRPEEELESWIKQKSAEPLVPEHVDEVWHSQNAVELSQKFPGLDYNKQIAPALNKRVELLAHAKAYAANGNQFAREKMMQAVPNEDRDQFKSIVAEVAPGLAKERGFVHQAFANFVAGSNELSGSAIGLARKGLSATRGAVAERVYGRGSQAAESEKAFLAQREKDRWDAGLADDFVNGAAQAQEAKSMANDSLALQFAKSAVFGIARAVPMMAAGGAVGTSLSPLTFFPQMQQEQEKKFRQEGHSEKWATIMSVPVGIVQAFIEKAGGNSTLAKNMKGQILKGAGNRIKQAI